MIGRRTFWFAVGAVSGAGAAAWSYAQVRRLRGPEAADVVATRIGGFVGEAGATVVDLLADARVEAAVAEEALRERYGLEDLPGGVAEAPRNRRGRPTTGR